MKGYIKNLRGYDVILQSIGWWLSANIVASIEDDMDYELFATAQDELEEKITSGDIEVQNATATAMSIPEFRTWMAQAWELERNIPKSYRIEAIFNMPVPTTGLLFLSHSAGSPHTVAGFGIDVVSNLRRIYVALNQAEPTNTYDIRIYKNPTEDAPSLVVSSKLSITPGSSRVFQIDDLIGVQLAAGEYGIMLERTAGSGQSTFTNGVVLLTVGGQ